jgi:hypothetical protein
MGTSQKNWWDVVDVKEEGRRTQGKVRCAVAGEYEDSVSAPPRVFASAARVSTRPVFIHQPAWHRLPGLPYKSDRITTAQGL